MLVETPSVPIELYQVDNNSIPKYRKEVKCRDFKSLLSSSHGCKAGAQLSPPLKFSFFLLPGSIYYSAERGELTHQQSPDLIIR